MQLPADIEEDDTTNSSESVSVLNGHGGMSNSRGNKTQNAAMGMGCTTRIDESS